MKNKSGSDEWSARPWAVYCLNATIALLRREYQARRGCFAVPSFSVLDFFSRQFLEVPE